jgi:transposase
MNDDTDGAFTLAACDLPGIPAPQRRPVRAVLGVDVSKARLDVVLRQVEETPQDSADHRKPLGSRKVVNSKWGIVSLLEWSIARAKCALSELRVVAEPTARYHLLLAHTAHQQGCDVVIANPRRTHQFGRAIGRLTKSDLVDADTLARFGMIEPRFHWAPPPPEIDELIALTQRRQDLHRAARREEARVRLQQEGHGRHPPAVDQSIESAVRFHAAAIEEITAELTALFQRSPRLAHDRQLLLSIPGIGDETANIFLCLLRSRNFTSAREAAALCGVVPVHHHSGADSERPGRVSPLCHRAFRAALYMPARSAIRCDSPFRILYERHLAAGKNYRQARVAVMHKLVRTAFGVLRNQKSYVASWQQLTPPERASLPVVHARKGPVQNNARRVARLARATRARQAADEAPPA